MKYTANANSFTQSIVTIVEQYICEQIFGAAVLSFHIKKYFQTEFLVVLWETGQGQNLKSKLKHIFLFHFFLRYTNFFSAYRQIFPIAC